MRIPLTGLLLALAPGSTAGEPQRDKGSHQDDLLVFGTVFTGKGFARGAEYEMTVMAAGYQEQARKIDARTGNREDLVFRLPQASGGKPR